MNCCNECKAVGIPGKITTPWCGKMGDCPCHKEKSCNYMQVGPTVECGHCNPIYAEGLHLAEKQPGFICDCICHKEKVSGGSDPIEKIIEEFSKKFSLESTGFDAPQITVKLLRELNGEYGDMSPVIGFFRAKLLEYGDIREREGMDKEANRIWSGIFDITPADGHIEINDILDVVQARTKLTS